MKSWKPLAVGLGALAIATATYMPVVVLFTRSVQPVGRVDANERLQFEPAQSAGLFVGVRKFDDDPSMEVQYAVDDAVDLAHTFAFDGNVLLLQAEHVVLVLSGEPVKEASRKRLAQLRDAGARVVAATEREIQSLLRQQAEAVGEDGLLVLSFATHGFMRDGVPYILGSDSIFPDKAIPAPEIFEIAATSPAPRSVIFLDACRQRISGDTRAAGGVATAAPHIKRMQPIQGQIVFSAAAAGGYAYDDDERQNGVFTRTVIDGLNCKAALDRGVVTADSLDNYVGREVRRWIRRKKKRWVFSATQTEIDTAAKKMPLARCGGPPPPTDPARIEFLGATAVAFDKSGRRLWQHDAGAAILGAKVADLDADGRSEVVVGTAAGLVAFDRTGQRLWSARGTLRQFFVDDLAEKKTHDVVALWSNGLASRVTVHGADGKVAWTHDTEERVEHIALDRRTKHSHLRLIVATAKRIFAMKANSGKSEWQRLLSSRERIEGLKVVDHDNQRAIVVSTPSGTFLLDFAGNAKSPSAPFNRVTPRRKR